MPLCIALPGMAPPNPFEAGILRPKHSRSGCEAHPPCGEVERMGEAAERMVGSSSALFGCRGSMDEPKPTPFEHCARGGATADSMPVAALGWRYGGPP
eukprot:6199474-Pleurochrysis_carterae.AAC.2